MQVLCPSKSPCIEEDDSCNYVRHQEILAPSALISAENFRGYFSYYPHLYQSALAFLMLLCSMNTSFMLHQDLTELPSLPPRTRVQFTSNNDSKRTVRLSLKSDLLLPAHEADKMCKDNI